MDDLVTKATDLYHFSIKRKERRDGGYPLPLSMTTKVKNTPWQIGLIQELTTKLFIPLFLRCWVLCFVNPNMPGGRGCQFDSPHSPLWFFEKPCFFVTFNIISKHIFPDNFIGFPQVVQKIWRNSLSILAIFINFLDFLTLPCYKETNDISL